MKSQDIFILLKLVSLQKQEQSNGMQGQGNKYSSFDDSSLEGWEEENDLHAGDRYSARGLSASIGVSKSEVNASINRSVAVGMAIHDRVSNYPKANRKALFEFIVYGLKYVFPAKPAEIVRGIPTAFSAPILKGEIMSAGEYIYVWPDAKGKEKGQSVLPLFKSVPMAVKKDPRLYEYLALVDAIRLGNPRESNVAIAMLKERLDAE